MLDERDVATCPEGEGRNRLRGAGGVLVCCSSLLSVAVLYSSSQASDDSQSHLTRRHFQPIVRHRPVCRDVSCSFVDCRDISSRVTSAMCCRCALCRFCRLACLNGNRTTRATTQRQKKSDGFSNNAKKGRRQVRVVKALSRRLSFAEYA